MYEEYQVMPNYRLLNDPYRLPVEQAVSDYYGLNWRVVDFKDMNDYASHPSAILSDGSRAVFVKLSEAANGLEQFEVELYGLRTLAERAGALTPTLIGLVPVESGMIMIQEAAQAVERTPEAWREIGRALARIHRVKGERFGFEKQGYFGPFYQDNRPADDWLTFFIERRLWPRLMGAIDSGHMTTEAIRMVERFIDRLPGLDIPKVQPTLLHGDAQQNNYISTARGAMVIDPAIYYGHPEMDLAHLDYFQPVPGDVFLGYQEILPIPPGFAQRRDLWRIPAYLAIVQLENSYLNSLLQAVQKYL